MKKLIIITSLLSLFPGFITAQLYETEPNDDFSSANPVTMNTTMSGITCQYPESDYFKIELPDDGMLVFYTSVSCNNQDAGKLTFGLWSNTGNQFTDFHVNTGFGGALPDTSYYGALAGDIFYFRVFSNIAPPACFTYEFYWKIIPPTYGNDPEPNDSYAEATFLPYNLNFDGRLGFRTEPGLLPTQHDYYKIVSPVDGTIRVFTSAECQGTNTNALSVSLFSGNQSTHFGDQYARLGPFLSPAYDTLSWGCLSGDTMYFRLFFNGIYDAGYSYRFRYDVIPATYENDIEPNNSFEEAQEMNYDTDTEGHLCFYSNNSNGTNIDYYRLTMPADGFIMLTTSAEYQSYNSNGITITLFGQDQNYIHEQYAAFGPFSFPENDTLIFYGLPEATYYFKLYLGGVYDCGISYRLRYKIPGTFSSDKEPNNTFAEAQSIPDINADTEGQLNYISADATDYFSFNLAYNSVTDIIIKSEAWQTSRENFTLSVFDEQFNQVSSTELESGNFPDPEADTVELGSLLAGKYYISVTTSAMMNYNIKIKATGNAGFGDLTGLAGLEVSPNPANEKITIEIPENPSQFLISIFNLSGQKIITRQVTGLKTVIDIRDYRPGLYFIRIEAEKAVEVHKFIKLD